MNEQQNNRTTTEPTDEPLKVEVLTAEELEALEKEERKKRRLANLRPMKKYSECTPEEIARQKEIVFKGGQANKEKCLQKKTLKEVTLNLLQSNVTKDIAKKYNIDSDIIDSFGEDVTLQEVLTARLLQEVLENGSSKAYETIRDTSGQKPTTELEINADIVTAADRALLDKFKSNLVEMHNTKIG